MALVTCGGADVLRARIVLPLDGAWSATLDLDAAEAPSGSVTIEAEGGLTLSGTVVTARAGVELDVAHVRVVGGRAGLAAEVSGAYRSAKLRDALGAVASASGETLDPSIASAVLGVDLAYLTLGRYACGRALGELASLASSALGSTVRWRVTDAGKLWLGEEAWPTATLPDGAELLESYPGEGRYVIGCETPALVPGVELDGVGQVAAVEHVIEPASVRTIAWTSTPPSERLRRTAREAIGLETVSYLPAIDRLALYRAQVMACAQDGTTVDVQPEDRRVPAAQKVPVRVGIPGAVAVVQPGAVVLVGWEKGDPSKPYAVPSWEMGATVVRLALSAQTKIEINGGAELDLDGGLIKLNGGTLPIARVTDKAGPYPITGGKLTVLG